MASILLTVTLGTWLKAHANHSTTKASSDVAVIETPAGGGSPTTSATPRPDPPPTPEGVGPVELAHIGRRSVTVGSVAMSFRPTAGWEAFGSISVNKSAFGPQSAEAIIYWTSMSDRDASARPCGQWWGSPVGSVADFAAGAAAVAGHGLVMGPSDVSIGGFPGKHVVFTVREDRPCEPGFFYRWRASPRGAFWSTTDVGDSINVWIVDVDGTRVFIESAIHRYAFEDAAHDHAGPELEREIQQIVGSIRFN